MTFPLMRRGSAAAGGSLVIFIGKHLWAETRSFHAVHFFLGPFPLNTSYTWACLKGKPKLVIPLASRRGGRVLEDAPIALGLGRANVRLQLFSFAPGATHGYGSKLSHQGTAGFSLWFDLSGFLFGVILFLTHSHMGFENLCAGPSKPMRLGPRNPLHIGCGCLLILTDGPMLFPAAYVLLNSGDRC